MPVTSGEKKVPGAQAQRPRRDKITMATKTGARRGCWIVLTHRHRQGAGKTSAALGMVFRHT
jgi:ATP:corrinoid adenosyltransferase